ncbi:hypothetical protein SNE40_003308 [Patella caerulea]|uniref:MADF domain-containing protein n=1 Tax=Patella caerulea TaxID=87958 RepID=A0AAN8KDM4_PATCE
MSKFREQMTKDQIDMLIEMYRCEECLWNTKHPSYYNKESRNQSTDNIIEAMEESFGTEFTAEYVSNKIQNLRSYYCRETRKKIAAKKGGDDYQCLWIYYDSLDCFLRNHVMPKRVGEQETNGSAADQIADIDEVAESDSEQLDVKSETQIKTDNNSDSERTPRVETKRKLSLTQSTSKTISRTSTRLESSRFKKLRPTATDCSEDEDMTFAKYLANEMRKVTDLRTKQLMKLKLQAIIFEAQDGPDI